MNELTFEEKKKILLSDMEKSNIKILNTEDSLNLIKSGKSIARLGDGELDIIKGKSFPFQRYNQDLTAQLVEILGKKQDFCLVGIPDAINNFDNLTQASEEFWVENMYRTRNAWIEYLNEDMTYCTANITRLYMRYKDKSKCKMYFDMLKDIYKDKDVIICEGEKTRAGVGNDLLDGCKSVQRLICPAENAFDKYDEIFKTLKEVGKNKTILLSLGPTATVLAYNLAKDGYHVIDTGNFDIEYEWFRMNAIKKEKINNKYSIEVENGRETDNTITEKYKKEIIAVIK
mgnify:CR=1 FL=1